MLPQFEKLFEAFATVAAVVRSLLRVAQHVYSEVPAPGTGLAALVAFIWFLPCVDQHVLLQSSFPAKLLPTDLTVVRFLPSVREEMLPQCVQHVEALIALCAGVRPLSLNLITVFALVTFTVLFVTELMQLQPAFSVKC